MEVNLQTPGLEFYIHGPSDKAGTTWHLDAPDLVGSCPRAKTVLAPHPGSNSAVGSGAQTLSSSTRPVFDGQLSELLLEGATSWPGVSTPRVWPKGVSEMQIC
jgi:hypothetical protein